MSYCTFDRYDGMRTTYAHARGGGAGAGMGVRTWWPDFGPGSQDFSQQRRSHPSEAIFERNVVPKRWSTQARPEPAPELPLASQFRNPEPARHAMLRVDPQEDQARKLAAHAVTERQGALRRLELRQKRVDAWLGDAPIRMSSAYLTDHPQQASLAHSSSEPSVGSHSAVHAAAVSRQVYEKHGLLVGKSQGGIAGGRTGEEAARRHNPLSYHAMMFSGDLQDGKNARMRQRSLKASKQWRTCPESRFVFDPRTFLPVPRGGWDSHPLALAQWPEPPPAGSREFISGQNALGNMTALPSPS